MSTGFLEIPPLDLDAIYIPDLLPYILAVLVYEPISEPKQHCHLLAIYCHLFPAYAHSIL